MDKILIIGGSGLVGSAIIREIKNNCKFKVYATYLNKTILLKENRSIKFDVDNPYSISDILNTINPQIVISCLRGNFNNQLIAHIKIAEYLKENGGRLYYFSTANVFDNDFSRVHYEDDLPDSCTEYGQFKIACEQKITEILHENACILRLPQVWGKDCPRINSLLNSVTNNEKITVYPNLEINTITDIVIAKKLFYIIENNMKGIFHLAASDFIHYKSFYDQLVKGKSLNNINYDQDFDEKGKFVILSKRDAEFPEQLQIINKKVIDYLI